MICCQQKKQFIASDARRFLRRISNSPRSRHLPTVIDLASYLPDRRLADENQNEPKWHSACFPKRCEKRTGAAQVSKTQAEFVARCVGSALLHVPVGLWWSGGICAIAAVAGPASSNFDHTGQPGIAVGSAWQFAEIYRNRQQFPRHKRELDRERYSRRERHGWNDQP